jgi:hypothetical protein
MPEEIKEDTSALEAEVEKSLDEDTNSEATTEETSEEKVDSTEKLDSEKTVEETETSEKVEDKDDEDRFDKHPRFQKLIQERDLAKQERDEAISEAREAKVIKETLGEMSLDELKNLKNASGLLKKYPKLREQIQKQLDEYPYGNEEVKGEVDSLKSEIAKDREERLLDKYDTQVDKLMIDKKVGNDIKTIVKEILDNRVVNQRISLENVPKAFEKVLKDIETFQRKTLASHIEDRGKIKNIPATTKSKGKETVTKKEPEETEDLVNDIASELKSSSKEFGEE